jgi:hypothetical protein
MSTHPNLVLMAVLTPDGLTRKTARQIRADNNLKGEWDELKIGKQEYYVIVMKDDWDESHQITAKEGNIVLHELMTYGYGESVSWDELHEAKVALDAWCDQNCHKYNCKYEIRVSANYW